MVTLFHPFLTGVSIRVAPANVDAWTGAGWLNSAPPEDYQDHAAVYATKGVGGYALKATFDTGGEITIPPFVTSPTNAKTSGVFDPARGIYNFKPAQIRRLSAALGRAYAKTGAANLAFLGDSTTAGVGASGQNWPQYVHNRLVDAGYPSTGTGLIGAYKSSGDDSRWAKGAGWNAMNSGTTMILNNTTANPAVFTSDISGTVARVFYSRRSNAPFTVSIDGGAPVTVTADGTTNAPAVYEVTGLPNTTHAISIVRAGTGSTGVQIFGAEVASATTGIRTYNAGIGGGKVPPTAEQNWFGVGQYATAATGFNADCVFVMYETNDSGYATPLADYKERLRVLLTSIKQNGTDAVLVTAVPSDLSSYSAPGPGILSDYTAALYELADEFDLPLIDLQDRMGSYGRINGLGLMSDKVHPSRAGYVTVANAVLDALRIF